MKKAMSTILPSIIIFLITFWGRADKNILVGLYILFPAIFIIQGAIYSDYKKHLCIGFLLSSIAFIIPINIWFRMGSCVELLIIYNILGAISFFIKKKLFAKVT